MRYNQNVYTNSKISLKGTGIPFLHPSPSTAWNKDVLIGALTAVLDHEDRGQTVEMVDWWEPGV